MSVPHLTEEDVKRQLTWGKLIPAIESALSAYSKKDESVIQPTRLILPIPQKKGVLLTMPGFSSTIDSLGCKMVTSFQDNGKRGLPTILASILLFNPDTGKLQALIDGTTITGWRTAAASAVATKHMHKGEKKVLAILGAGTQGRTHAQALQHAFKFQEVRIWNRTVSRAEALCKELGAPFKPYTSNEACVTGADVVCTVTSSPEPVLKSSWLKRGAHINAVGAGVTHHSELDVETYKRAVITVDSLESAKKELTGLFDMKAKIEGEIGEVINGKILIPKEAPVTVFHSMGMAIEDVAAADLIYKSYLGKSKN